MIQWAFISLPFYVETVKSTVRFPSKILLMYKLPIIGLNSRIALEGCNKQDWKLKTDMWLYYFSLSHVVHYIFYIFQVPRETTENLSIRQPRCFKRFHFFGVGNETKGGLFDPLLVLFSLLTTYSWGTKKSKDEIIKLNSSNRRKLDSRLPRCHDWIDFWLKGMALLLCLPWIFSSPIPSNKISSTIGFCLLPSPPRFNKTGI